MSTEQDAYDALCAYTLVRGDAAFVHQHVVDAFAAQQADGHTKPIGLTFALVGLYLAVERQWSGRQVQRAHMRLGQQRRPWPTFVLPAQRGPLTAIEVMAEPPGRERDAAIRAWCESVWRAYCDCRETVVSLLREQHIV